MSVQRGERKMLQTLAKMTNFYHTKTTCRSISRAHVSKGINNHIHNNELVSDQHINNFCNKHVDYEFDIELKHSNNNT